MRNYFRSIGAAKQLARTATGIFVKTPTEDLRVTVLAEDVVRVTMKKQAQSCAELPSCAVIKHEWPGVDVEIKESPTDISIITGKLHVRISKSPIRVGFYRPNGTPICLDTANSGMGWTRNGAACFKTLPVGTRFYGFGERTGYLDKRGTAMTLWNTDTTLHTPSTDSLYVSIPFFIGFNQGHAYGLS